MAGDGGGAHGEATSLGLKAQGGASFSDDEDVAAVDGEDAVERACGARRNFDPSGAVAFERGSTVTDDEDRLVVGSVDAAQVG